MDIKEYFELTQTDKMELAYRCKISMASVNYYIRGRRPCKEIAQRIEDFTEGKVTVAELRKKRIRKESCPKKIISYQWQVQPK